MTENLKPIIEKAFLEKKVKNFLHFGIVFYKCHISPQTGGACRFKPSCSDYAMEALKSDSIGQALKQIIKRISRCRPLGPYGYDPHPSSNLKKEI